MIREEIETKIFARCERLGLEIKDNQSTFSDMGIDSLSIVELVMEVEVEFDISIEDKDLPPWLVDLNLNWIIDYVEPLINADETKT